MDSSIEDNEGIQEAREMLNEFTQDNGLMEQYQFYEERLRLQRVEEDRRVCLQKELEQEKKTNAKYLQRLEKIEKSLIGLMKKSGKSDEEIAQLLEISQR